LVLDDGLGTGRDTMRIDYDRIKKLVSLVEDNQLTELAVEEDGLSITIKAESSAAAAPVAQASALVEVQGCHAPASEALLPERTAQQPAPEHVFEITSPMIGVFYRRPSPDSPPYVEAGDLIEAEQTVGLIEAMKVFSEVLSEVAGRVVTVPAESGKLVQQGDVLLVVDTSGAEA